MDQRPPKKKKKKFYTAIFMRDTAGSPYSAFLRKDQRVCKRRRILMMRSEDEK